LLDAGCSDRQSTLSPTPTAHPQAPLGGPPGAGLPVGAFSQDDAPSLASGGGDAPASPGSWRIAAVYTPGREPNGSGGGGAAAAGAAPDAAVPLTTGAPGSPAGSAAASAPASPQRGVVRAEVAKLERRHAEQVAALKGELAEARADAESARLALRRLRYCASRAASEARSRRASRAGGEAADPHGPAGAEAAADADAEAEAVIAVGDAVEAELLEGVAAGAGPCGEDPLALQGAVIGVLQAQVAAAQQLALERGAALRALERRVSQLSSGGKGAAAGPPQDAAPVEAAAAGEDASSPPAAQTEAAEPEQPRGSSDDGAASSRRSSLVGGGDGAPTPASAARKRRRGDGAGAVGQGAGATPESSPERRYPLLGPDHFYSDAVEGGLSAALALPAFGAVGGGADVSAGGGATTSGNASSSSAPSSPGASGGGATSGGSAPPLRSPSPERLALEARLALRGSAAQSRMRALLATGGLSAGGGAPPLVGTVSDDGSITLEASQPEGSQAGPARRSALGARPASEVSGDAAQAAASLSADSSAASVLHAHLAYVPLVDAASDIGTPGVTSSAGGGGPAPWGGREAAVAQLQQLRWELEAKEAQVGGKEERS
jgi:hypothetical protein